MIKSVWLSSDSAVVISPALFPRGSFAGLSRANSFLFATRRIARFSVCPLVWLVVAVTAVAATPAMAAGCPERPACRGCGCKGGPGYRGPDGRCVGFQALRKVCGDPPESRCRFENAPGTGANRECALTKPPKGGEAAAAEDALPSLSR